MLRKVIEAWLSKEPAPTLALFCVGAFVLMPLLSQPFPPSESFAQLVLLPLIVLSMCWHFGVYWLSRVKFGAKRLSPLQVAVFGGPVVAVLTQLAAQLAIDAGGSGSRAYAVLVFGRSASLVVIVSSFVAAVWLTAAALVRFERTYKPEGAQHTLTTFLMMIYLIFGIWWLAPRLRYLARYVAKE